MYFIENDKWHGKRDTEERTSHFEDCLIVKEVYAGKVVEIEGNKITMNGVKEDLRGISKQTGEKKIMKPNKNYTFSNTKSVIEIPLFKNK